MNCVTIVLARGGSKGIPRKNIVDFCSKPLIAWTIEQFQQAKDVHSVWVSSDSQEILSISENYGANLIVRPDNISGDMATSESAWLHAVNYIERKDKKIDLVLAPQVSSPLRESQDIERGIREFQEQQCDSMFSCSMTEDLFFWEKDNDGNLRSVNYDYKNRKRRQDIPRQFIENGSFYLFKPEILRKYNNRFGGKIGLTQMEFWKMFEIDSMEDLKMCEALMRAFLL
jgi:CMP-N,N'-diacetyllegionaminic acid synthase